MQKRLKAGRPSIPKADRARPVSVSMSPRTIASLDELADLLGAKKSEALADAIDRHLRVVRRAMLR